MYIINMAMLSINNFSPKISICLNFIDTET